MFTKIKQFFLGKPAAEAQAPYKIEAPWTHAEDTSDIAIAQRPMPVAKPVAAKPKTAPRPKKPAAAKPA